MDINSIDNSNYLNSPYFNKIENLIATFRNTAVASSTIIDITLLTQNTLALNIFVVKQKILISTFSMDYPYLDARLNTVAVITPAETQTFIDTNLLVAQSFATNLNDYNLNILMLLNTFYGPNQFSGSGTASFCALVPNIFAQYDALKNAFNNISSFVQDFEKKLNSLSNMSLSGLLNTVKSHITDMIDSMIAKIKNKISAFSSIFTTSSNFPSNKNAIHSKIIDETSNLNSLMSDDSISALKSNLQGALAFATNLFENPKIEEIEFLLLRFCELMNNIENFFNSSTDKLQNILSNYSGTYDVLKGSGLQRSIRAVSAGATRYDDNTLTQGMAAVTALPETTTSETSDNNSTSSSGGAEPLRKRSDRIQPITSAETDEVASAMSYSSVLGGTSPYILYRPGPFSASSGGLGWNNVRALEKVMIMRLSKALGAKLIINSAWRSLATQALIRQGHESTIPKSGYHQAGQAFDCSREAFGDEINFINMARSVGFGGIGRYPTFIHVDSRASDLTFR